MPGCRSRSAAPADEVNSTWEGPITALAPRTTNAWLYADLVRVRADPRMGDLWPTTAETAVERAIVGATEVLVTDDDLTDSNALLLIRSSFDLDELDAELSSSQNFTRSALSRVEIEGRSAWRHPSRDWVVAVIEPDILIVGSEAPLTAALALSRQPSQQAQRDSAPIAFSAAPTPALLEQLQNLVDSNFAQRQIAAITRLTGAIGLADPVVLTTQIQLGSQGSPDVASALVGVALQDLKSELGDGPDLASLRAVVDSIDVQPQQGARAVSVRATIPDSELRAWLEILSESAPPSELFP